MKGSLSLLRQTFTFGVFVASTLVVFDLIEQVVAR